MHPQLGTRHSGTRYGVSLSPGRAQRRVRSPPLSTDPRPTHTIAQDKSKSQAVELHGAYRLLIYSWSGREGLSCRVGKVGRVGKIGRAGGYIHITNKYIYIYICVIIIVSINN